MPVVERVASALMLMGLWIAPCLAQTPQAKTSQTPTSSQDTAKPLETPVDPYLDVATSQIGRALLLRCLCVADTFEFDANGRLENPKTKSVDWTLAGIDITKVEHKGPEVIDFEGFRVAIGWNDDVKEFRRHQLKTEPVKIVIHGATTPETLRRAFSGAFSLGIDRAFQLSLPAYWQHYFDTSAPWTDDPLKAVAIYRPGDMVGNEKVTQPKVLNKPMASYTAEAARDNVSGAAILRLVVDASGTQHHVAIYQPLGYGLDAKAIEAIEKIKFAPSTVAGKPAAVAMLVRQDFEISTLPAGGFPQ